MSGFTACPRRPVLSWRLFAKHGSASRSGCTIDLSVTELAKPFLRKMSLPAVTKHLKVLEGAGLITKKRDAQRRLCELNPAGFKETLEFMDMYREMMEQSLDRLEEFLKTSEVNSTSNKRKK